jgi:ribosomal protein S18 acetylase RimI-like enzyme
MSCKLQVNELGKLKNPYPFAQTIYNNFKHLACIPQLQHSMEEIVRLLSDDSFFGFTVINSCSNNIVGYLIGELKNLDDGRYVCYISYIYVAQKFRNLKVGSYLIDKVKKLCSDSGIQFLLLTCDSNDERVYTFYKTKGFVQDPIIPGVASHTVLVYYL